MAFPSLADELAGAIDGGGARSLAEEFGLDLGYEAGIQADITPQSTPAQATLPLPSALTPSPAVSKSSRITPSKYLRTGKSSSSSYHTAQSSANAGVDEFDISLELELGPTVRREGPSGVSGGDEGGIGIDLGLALRDEHSPHLDDEVHGVRDRDVGLDSVEARNGWMAPKVEKDPLVTLRESLESCNRFLHTLRNLDSPVPKRIRTPGRRAEAEDGDVKGEWAVEDGLERHLHKLHEAERMREEQLRELVGIGREFEVLRWGEGLPWDGEPGLVVLDEEDEVKDVGWIGEPVVHDAPPSDSTPPPDPRLQIDGIPINRDEEIELNPHEALDDLLDPSHLLDADRPSLSAHPSFSPSSSLPPLPHEVHLLLSDTLLPTLHTLSESLHVSTSHSTSLSRTLRGIRAGIDSWRERQAAEEAARLGIEAWEARRVERGLKGEGAGEVMRREIRGFEEAVEGWGRRMGEMRKEVLAP